MHRYWMAVVITLFAITALPSRTFAGDACTAWQTPTPLPRSGAASVYDTARQRVVVFGGRDDMGTLLSDVWEWDGLTWSARLTGGPLPRHMHALAYDSNRHRIVLFGGTTGPNECPGGFLRGSVTHFNDTWEFDGTHWELRTTSGPPPQFGHAMAYHSGRKCVVLYGANGETWEWSGEVWTQHLSSGPLLGPRERFGHGMAYDASRDRIVLFGGNPFPLADTWEWDGITWTQAAATDDGRAGPACGVRLAYDRDRGRVVRFGGIQATGDTYEWDSAHWTVLTTDGPGKQALHTFTYDDARRRMVLFGADTWEFDGISWLPRSPGRRAFAAMAYDPARMHTVLFGGRATSDFGDTWEWNGSSWRFADNGGTAPRAEHALAYDGAGVILFGGIGGCHSDFQPCDCCGTETMRWDGLQWHPVAEEGTTGNRWVGMSYDSGRERVVLYAGFPFLTAEPHHTWEWYGLSPEAEWQNIIINPTSPQPGYSAGHSLAFDSQRGETVLFGGWYYGPRPDVWEWNGKRWNRFEPSGIWPPLRYSAAMVYDDIRNRSIVFGGRGEQGPSDLLGDMWAWDGAGWTEITAGSARPRYGHTMVWDAQRGRMVMFGGYTAYPGNISADLWEFGESSPPIILDSPRSAIACPGSSITLWVTLAGADPSSAYQWRKDSTDIPGANSNALTFDQVSDTQAGTYDVVVSNVCASVLSNPVTVLVCDANDCCDTNADCDDGIFCNGTETCSPHGCCQAGESMCCAGQSCNPVTGLCEFEAPCDCDCDCDCVADPDDACPCTPAQMGVDSSGRPLGDVDGDCDVDLVDFHIMQGNFTGFVNPACPDNVCGLGENCSNCPQDCPCLSGEACHNCSCVVIPPCPDGVCGMGENCSTCPQDCTCAAGFQCNLASCVAIVGCPDGACRAYPKTSFSNRIAQLK